jgi:hypothetical protein
MPKHSVEQLEINWLSLMITFTVSLLVNYQSCIVIDFDSQKKISIEVSFWNDFPCEIKLFYMKFIYRSYEIHAFQRRSEIS